MHASEILRSVREHGGTIELTFRGRSMARLVPIVDGKRREPAWASVWAEMDDLAREIAAHWPKGISAEDAIREDRRDL